MFARPGNRGTREQQRQPGGVGDDLDDIRIEEFLQAAQRMRDRRDVAFGPRLKQARDRTDGCRVDQRFVGLNVHDHVRRLKTQLLGGLREPVGARWMSDLGQNRLDSVLPARGQNAHIVGAHHHAAGPAGGSLPRDADHHRHSGQIGQGLFGQAAGSQARRNQRNEIRHGQLSAQRPARSSSSRRRASLSSMIGMPSRIG